MSAGVVKHTTLVEGEQSQQERERQNRDSGITANGIDTKIGGHGDRKVI